MVRAITLTVSFTIFLICSVLWWQQNRAVVAEVGSYKILKEQVAYQEDVNRIVIPEAMAGDFALKQLIKVYSYAQIMKDFGRPITGAMLDQEAERIDRGSLQPETLAKIKKLRFIDRGLYKSVYVMSALSQQLIFSSFYFNTPAIHLNTKGEADRVLELLKSRPGDLIPYAKAHGLVAFDVSLSAKQGLFWRQNQGTADENPALPSPAMALKNLRRKGKNVREDTGERKREVSAEELAAASRWIKEVVLPTDVGAMFPYVVDDNQRWLVVRREKNTGDDRFNLTALQLPKMQFQEWIPEALKKVPVTIKAP